MSTDFPLMKKRVSFWMWEVPSITYASVTIYVGFGTILLCTTLGLWTAVYGTAS